MPPAARKPKRTSDAVVVPDADPSSDGMNASFLAELRSIHARVFQHEVFRDLRDTAGIGFDQIENSEKQEHRAKKAKVLPPSVGVQATFDPAQCKASMHSHGMYRCAENELCLDVFFTMQNGIPYSRSSIFQLANDDFKVPNAYAGSNIVVVTDRNYNPMAHRGAWRRLSREEPNWARIIGIDMAISEGASEEVL